MCKRNRPRSTPEGIGRARIVSLRCRYAEELVYYGWEVVDLGVCAAEN